VGKFDPANLSEMVGDKIQERFGYFLGIAESICNIAERQITRGKMLMPHNVAWRVPLTIELEAPPIIDMPELNVHDLESYFRQDR
jgi:hypothetical protein